MKTVPVSKDMWHKICDLRKEYNLKNNNEVIEAIYNELMRLQEAKES